MSISIISFTQTGMELSQKLSEKLKQEEIRLFTKCTYGKEKAAAQGMVWVEETTESWSGRQMQEKHALLFIGACGIAVRAIAPHIADKLYDSPVLVMDEKGRYVIPILSGHMGGANEKARMIAEATGAAAVITTATDIQGKFAADLFAKQNELQIVNKDGIAKVSAKVLAGKEIVMAVDKAYLSEKQNLPHGVRVISYPTKEKADIIVSQNPPQSDAMLYLCPKEYVLGIGCRRGKEEEKIRKMIQKCMEEAGIAKEKLFAVASIDIKQDEPGILAWCRKEKIPFLTFSAEELEAVKGDFHTSDFVRQQTGVDNVCERAAIKACEPTGELIYAKHAMDGITIAIAQRKRKGWIGSES